MNLTPFRVIVFLSYFAVSGLIASSNDAGRLKEPKRPQWHWQWQLQKSLGSVLWETQVLMFNIALSECNAKEWRRCGGQRVAVQCNTNRTEQLPGATLGKSLRSPWRVTLKSSIRACEGRRTSQLRKGGNAGGILGEGLSARSRWPEHRLGVWGLGGWRVESGHVGFKRTICRKHLHYLSDL